MLFQSLSNVQLKSHQDFLIADTENQKLFVMLKLQPTKAVIAAKPATAFVFLIDTSKSMYEIIDGEGKSKIDVMVESLIALLRVQRLNRSAQIAIVQFDDNSASTLIELTPITNVDLIGSAINKLRSYSDETHVAKAHMAKGMRQTLDIFAKQTGMASRRALVFTDGVTFDEFECQSLAQDFATQNISITALGVGEYNEDLLLEMSDKSGGRSFHVADSANGTSLAISDLPATITDEFTRAQQDVITNLALSAKTVKGMTLTRMLRAYPDQAEFPINTAPYPIGNAAASDETVFIMEFNLDSRPASRVRIAQVELTYDIPGSNRRGDSMSQNLIVEFIEDPAGTIQIDQEVMCYVQQCNISKLI